MHTHRRLCALLLLLCMACGLLPAASAQEEIPATAVYAGVVVDPSGKPLHGVTVTVWIDREPIRTKTNHEGNWLMTLPTTDTYTFHFDKEGYSFSKTVHGQYAGSVPVNCGTQIGTPVPPSKPVHKPQESVTPIPEPKREEAATRSPEPKREEAATSTPEPKREEVATPTQAPKQEEAVTPTQEHKPLETATPTPEPILEAANTVLPTHTPAPETPTEQTDETPQPSQDEKTSGENAISQLFAAFMSASATATPEPLAEELEATQAPTASDLMPNTVSLAAPVIKSPGATVETLPVQITWDAVSNAAHYSLEVLDESGGVIVAMEAISATSYSLNDALVADENYTVRVRAYPAAEDTDLVASEAGTFRFLYQPAADDAPDAEPEAGGALETPTLEIPEQIEPEQTESPLQAPVVEPIGNHSVLKELSIAWSGETRVEHYALTLHYLGGDAPSTEWTLSVDANEALTATIPANAFANPGAYRLDVQASAAGLDPAWASVSFTASLSIMPMAAVIMPYITAPDSVVSGVPFAINWSQVEGAAYYLVSMRTKDASRTLLSETRVSGMTYTFTGALTDGQEYTISVRAAYNSGGYSGTATRSFRYSASAGAAVPLDTPAVRAPGSSVTGVPFDITWDAVANADHYLVTLYDETAKYNIVNARKVTGNSYTVDASMASLFKAGRTYTVYVCAVPTDNNISYLQSAWATRSFNYQPGGKLTTPTMTHPTDGATVGAGAVTFRWNGVDRVQHYSITLTKLPSTTIVSLNVNASTSYTSPNLAAGDYTLTVTAHASSGSSHVNDSDTAVITFHVTAADQPSIGTVTATPSTIALGAAFTLSFTARNANKARLVIGGSAIAETSITSSSALRSYTWPVANHGISAGTHQLQLQVSGDNGVSWSDLSSAVTLTVLANTQLGSPVIDSIPDQKTGTDISISWAPVENAVSYEVYFGKDGASSLTKIGTVTAPMIVIPGYLSTSPGTYQMIVYAKAPANSGIADGVATLKVGVVTTSFQPWYGWVQAYTTPVYYSASSRYPIDYIAWNRQVYVIGESGAFYQIQWGGDYWNTATGYVLKSAIGTNPWNPCQDSKHELITRWESKHPHRQYVACKHCNYLVYTGWNMTNARPAECCYCGNHDWGAAVAAKKHPHSTGVMTCTRCGETKTVKLTAYKLKSCGTCYPSATSPSATATATPNILYDSQGNRLYDTGAYGQAFNTAGNRANGYAYVPTMYDSLRQEAQDLAQSNEQSIPLSVLFTACFTPLDEQWYTEQYLPARSLAYQDYGLAYLTFLIGETAALREYSGADDAFQQAAQQLSATLAELLALEDVLDLEARSFLTLAQERCAALAISTPARALSGTADENIRFVLDQIFQGIAYDSAIVDQTLQALGQTLGEPDSVRALSIVYAIVDYKHSEFTKTLSMLPAYATYEQIELVQSAYEAYLLALAQLHPLAQHIVGGDTQSYQFYWSPELRRNNNVNQYYTQMFEE